MPLNLRIGVLVVGSLDWESKSYGGDFVGTPDPVRLNWRKTRLKADKRSTQYVRVPIRYGRRSEKRGNTYTMVFSPALGGRLGLGKIIRCRHAVDSIDDLMREARELWTAEQKEDQGNISAKWGCVALLKSPHFLDHEDADLRKKLLDDWAANTQKIRNYGVFGFSGGDVAEAGGKPVIDEGRLNIPWPRFKNHWPLSLDLVLVTATNPEIVPGGKDAGYPDAEGIARPWKANSAHAIYFRNNRLAGIQTADDDEIEKYLDR